jgi:membrane-bound lytic murein transglycosylase F
MGRLELNKSTRFVTTSKTVSREWVENFEKETPLARVQVLPQPRSTALFRQLLRGRSDCLLLDRLQAEYDLRSYPELRHVKDLRSYQQYQFAVSPQQEEIARDLRLWFPRAASSGTLRQIKERYKNYLDELTPMEQAEFTRFFSPRFQPFAKYFKRYSSQSNIPWQLAAAVAYQESHLNPEARSWTGVRGLMQLTQETAQHVGIEDRTDPQQSIRGGAKYLHILLARQPKNLPDRERLALALATYNVGPAHMWDAQNLAVRLGKDPYSWKDIRSVLPKLGNPYYAHMLRYGPARGDEPVEFVDRVLSYLDLILIASSSPTPRPVFVTQR